MMAVRDLSCHVNDQSGQANFEIENMECEDVECKKQEAIDKVALGKNETLTAKVELLTLLPIATA
jgi:hypothetical protein